jgi:1-phosphatidylinositol-3-phosphate 5-kinase
MQILLRGACWEELKKVKRAMLLAVFAAYHLFLETSFLADEGATLPRIPSVLKKGATELQNHTEHVFYRPAEHGIPDGLGAAEEKYPHDATINQIFEDVSSSSTLLPLGRVNHGVVPEREVSEFPADPQCHPNASCHEQLISPGSLCDDLGTTCAETQCDDSHQSLQSPTAADVCHDGALTKISMGMCHLENCKSHSSLDNCQEGDVDDQDKLSAGYLSGTDNNQNILVSFSSTCIPKSLACERSHFFRIKFYGSFDKPLGRYLREELFDQVFLLCNLLHK